MNFTVTDHALWRFAERVKRSVGADEIVEMIRQGMTEGRVSPHKLASGLAPGARDDRLYVWTPDNIVFSLSIDGNTFVVRTVMTPYKVVPDRRQDEWLNGSRLQRSS